MEAEHLTSDRKRQSKPRERMVVNFLFNVPTLAIRHVSMTWSSPLAGLAPCSSACAVGSQQPNGRNALALEPSDLSLSLIKIGDCAGMVDSGEACIG